MGQRRYLKARVAAFAAATVAAILAIPASALASGAIEGAIAEAGTGTPVASLSVCAEENYLGGVSSGCTLTGPTGHYAIGGLPAGSNYQVEFTAQGGSLNYLTQYYNGREVIPGEWDPVAVVDGGTTTGINAQVRPGAQIAGHVAEQGTGASLVRVEVCVLNPAPNPRAEEFERCAYTDDAGDYVVRSLPAGTYVVVFARYRPPIDSSPFAEQYYADATSKAAASAISITPPETRSGIDASLVNRLRATLRHLRGFRTVTRHRRVRVGFRFFAPTSVASFICKRDRGPWRSCRSPQRFWAPIGRHAFRVRAIGPTGLKGPIALDRFRVQLDPGVKHPQP